MSVKIKIIQMQEEANVDGILELYRESNWISPSEYNNPKLIGRIIDGSFCFALASIDGMPIGMGRVISDETSDAYIQDIYVKKAHRGTGLGKQIVSALVTYLREHNMPWVALIAEPGTEHFYTGLGFKPMSGHIPMKLES